MKLWWNVVTLSHFLIHITFLSVQMVTQILINLILIIWIKKSTLFQLLVIIHNLIQRLNIIKGQIILTQNIQNLFFIRNIFVITYVFFRIIERLAFIQVVYQILVFLIVLSIYQIRNCIHQTALVLLTLSIIGFNSIVDFFIKLLKL